MSTSTAAPVAPPTGDELVALVADRFLAPRRADPAPWPAADAPAWLTLPVDPYWHKAGALKLAVYAQGEGPAVLLLHGWEGQAADMAAFIEPLRRRGHRVVGLDLPAHGRSEGRRMSIPMAAAALRAVEQAHGPWGAAIAHSMGGPILVEALAQGVTMDRVALIAPPTHYGQRARQVASMAGLDAAQAERMLAQLAVRVGTPLDQVDMAARAPQRRQAALFVHSSDDRTVAAEEVDRAARAWPGAVRWTVDGLGHRRLLDDAAVVERIVDFVCPAR